MDEKASKGEHTVIEYEILGDPFLPIRTKEITIDPKVGCVGDFNLDGLVDGADRGLLLGAWGPAGDCSEFADLDGDAMIDGNDLGILLGQWGACP